MTALGRAGEMTIRLETISIRIGDRDRNYLLGLPPDTNSPAALIVMLHGAGATAAIAVQQTGWAALAATAGFAVAFPEGTARHADRAPQFRLNPQIWNDGSGRGHVTRAGVDDVAFIEALLDDVARRVPVDPHRVYLAGFSNGAGLALYAGAALASRVAAVGAVAGHYWGGDDARVNPVALLHIFGTADPLNPVAGGEVITPWGGREVHPPVKRSAARWAVACGCSGPVTNTVSGDVEWTTFGCGGRADVRVALVPGLGHVWPGGPRLLPERIVGPRSTLLDGTATLWDFFQRHRKT